MAARHPGARRLERLLRSAKTAVELLVAEMLEQLGEVPARRQAVCDQIVACDKRRRIPGFGGPREHVATARQAVIVGRQGRCGEGDEIGWWHEQHTGFAGRRPISELYEN